MRYKSSDIKDIILKFTLLFALCSVIVWLPFIAAGMTFVWNADGVGQHIPALLFYKEWLGQFPDLPLWSFSLGEGADVITTLHHYCIGDPLELAAVLIPSGYIGVYYTVAAVLRIYLAGIAFIFYVRKLKPCASVNAFLCAGLTYSFSYWALYCSVRHMFFLNPLLLLPLMLLGMEKTGRGEKPFFFIFVTCISAVTNVYFFYMLVLICVIYGLIRFPKIKILLKIMASGLAGCLMGSFILIPEVISLLGDTRSSDRGGALIFYGLDHYLKLPQALSAGGTDDYLLLGFGAAGVIFIIYMITVKGNIKLKIFSLVCLLFMTLPFLGRVMNGMSYVTNRWSFAATLLFSCVIFFMWDDLLDKGSLDFKKLLIAFAAYGLFILVISVFKGDMVLSLCQVIFGVLFVCFLIRVKKSTSFVLAVIVVSNLAVNGLLLYLPFGRGYVEGHLTNDRIFQALEQSDSHVMKDSLPKDASGIPQRYTGPYLSENTSAVYGTNSTQYYWSQANPYVTDARFSLLLPEYRNYYYEGYDSRAQILDLANVRYFIVPEKDKDAIAAPAGFDYFKTEGGYVIYSTEHATGFVSFYDEEISRRSWDEMDLTSRQDIMTDHVVIPGEGKNEGAFVTDAKVLAEYSGMEFTSSGDETFKTEVDCPEDGELYVVLEGLEFKGSEGQTRADITVSGIGLAYYTSDFNWYNGRHDFAVNLGTVKEGIRKPTLKFLTSGKYSISNIRVELMPCRSIIEKTDKLKEASRCISNIKVENDRVTFDVDADKEGYLVVKMPYSSGWKAMADGKVEDTFAANIMYTGIKVTSGHHKISFSYVTPGLVAGIIISISSFLLFIGALIFVSLRKGKGGSSDPADKDIRIAVASHKPYPMPEGEMYVPVLAGASVSGYDLPEGWKADNTGDNISQLNPYYSELTAYYWAVKNLDPKPDYIGLVHYRRLFGKKRSGPVKKEQIAGSTASVKIFVPKPRDYFIETLGSHYSHTLESSHLRITGETLKNICPEYYPSWEKILNEKSGYMFNMQIMERSLAEEYLDWLMKVLAKVTAKKDPKDIKDAFAARYPGRISELLFNCWLDHNVSTGRISPESILELDYYSTEKVNWLKKGTAFLKAKFLGRKYHKSF